MPDYISYKEAAELLGIRPETLRKWVQARKIPFTRYNKRNVKFQRSALIEWQEQKTYSPIETKNRKTVREQRKEERLRKSCLDNQIDEMLAVHYGNKIPKPERK
jgi:excisionase family DNA binding protein